MASTNKYAKYAAAEPYFALVREALGDLVDGDHFFDTVSKDITYEVLYELGWPPVIHGRVALLQAFAGYGDIIELQAADNLITHLSADGTVLVIEYQVHGVVLASQAQYDNRFCSIITIENRKVTGWRDYMDSLAASTALSAPRHRR